MRTNNQSISVNNQELSKIPGAEPSSRIDAWWWLVALVMVATLLLVICWPNPFWRMIRFFVEPQVSDELGMGSLFTSGIGVTIFITVTSFIFVIVFGFIGGLGRLSHNWLIYGISTLYVELVRGVPLLVQLIWWYYAFPAVIQKLGHWVIQSLILFPPTPIVQLINAAFKPLAQYKADPISMAVLGLVFCYGAFMSEIYRAGIQSIPKGQMEAARSLGMTYLQAMRYIILPQAIRIILPPVGNEFIALLKDSSLVSVVAVTDLTRRGREFMSTNFNPIETWGLVALLYLIMTLFSARIINYIERKNRIEK